MKRALLSFTAILITLGVYAQVENKEHTLLVQSGTLVSTGDQVPFWLQMNQLGVYDDVDSFQQLFILSWERLPIKYSPEKIQLSYGVNVMSRLSNDADSRFNEYWGRLHLKKWYLHAGAKSEPVFANGLSLTNGNLFLSNNARPMPRVEFGTQNLQPFNNGWLTKFAFDFQFAEYFLLDDRYVEDAHLHHKRLDVSYAIDSQWMITAGIDHWVFWGGNSPQYGEMPGSEDYFRYILGKTGSSSAPTTDQMNVAGNQLGQYVASVTHTNDDYQLKFYWEHLWEDRSGIQFENAPDGLLGVYWQKKAGQKLLESMLIEYVNTRDQSGQHHKFTPDPENPEYQEGEGQDNYFNHGVYHSGFVSYGRMIGLPLLVPDIDENGVSSGFKNTRLWAIHHGMNGWLSPSLSWKTLLSYSKHYGLYGQEYASPKQFLSLAAQVGYAFPQKPVSCSLKLAYDKGSVLNSAFGAEFKLAFRIK